MEPVGILPLGTVHPLEFVHLWCFDMFLILTSINQKFQEAAEQQKSIQTAKSWSDCHSLCIFKAQVWILGLSHVNSVPATHPPHQHQDIWN